MKGLTLYLLISVLGITALNAQTLRGLGMPADEKPKVEGKTYALIVGISNYKNPAIPKLQFADRDALAFRNYLVETGVDSDNIILLINERATNAEFWTGIDFIMDITKAGDRVYLYFSGHGDVENKTIVKDAYLLPYDAPPYAYASCAIPVLQLKSWIETFSANGVQPIFVADACRSGNLAGHREGVEAAAAMLKDTWKDEIKILSCQPGEFSLEGKLWGNGRGLFSYEFIKALSGFADKNHDGKVTLKELNLYLIDRVSEEASPFPQNPVIMGNMDEVISRTNPDLMDEASFSGNNGPVSNLETKGMEESLLAGLDKETIRHYRQFRFDIDSIKSLFLLTSESAEYHLNSIPDSGDTRTLHRFMEYQLGLAALKEIDSSINREVLGKFLFLGREFSFIDISWDFDFWYDSPSAECISFLKKVFGEKKLQDMGYLSKINSFPVRGENSDTSIARQSLQKINSAILIDSNSAYLYARRAKLEPDTGEKKADLLKALQLSPGYRNVYLKLSEIFIEQRKYDSANLFLNKLASIDSISLPEVFIFKSIIFDCLQRQDSVGFYLYETIENWPEHEYMFRIRNFMDNTDLAHRYLLIASLFAQFGRDSAALKLFEKSFALGLSDIDRKIFLPKANKNYAICATQEYKILMRKYFPEQYKE